jgi:anthranilate synthase component 1
MVERTKKYIYDGDIIQAVLSQRFSADIPYSPFAVYRALRMVNPSPYMFLLNCGDFSIVGASPEVMAKCEGKKITVRPIAGTRKRGGDEQADKALENELLADPKERAEHIMLVDLGRNDIGRIAREGSVRVDNLMTVERYSHVMHIVSNVTGILDTSKYEPDSVMRSTFPAGTLSGAPKVRAMQIISELENERRGPYGGTVAYYSFDGNINSCITIRTAVLKDGKAYFQSGAGIVADSDPEKEYEETENKARAMLKAISMAEFFEMTSA